jgi:hypothetical protein
MNHGSIQKQDETEFLDKKMIENKFDNEIFYSEILLNNF